MNDEQRKKLQKLYSLLKGTYNAIHEDSRNLVQKSIVETYNHLLIQIEELLQDSLIKYYIILDAEYYDKDAIIREVFLYKLLPMLQYLEDAYINSKDDEVRKIGSLYNSITDIELQRRCGDLLSSEGAFDRVINQATQILEDRIKKKAGLEDSVLLGLSLVSKAIHSKLDQTILKFSNKNEEQESWALLFKGIIGIYRNPTHHGIEYECTREEALKVCSYIDILLQEVENSKKMM